MPDHENRLQAVERFKQLDLQNDPEFQELIQMASEICNMPIALLTLLDEDTQWLKVRKGTEVSELPRAISFCTHTIFGEELLIISDTTGDPRFDKNPTVTGAPGIRFYAGMPLVTSDRHKIGAICVLDRKPGNLNKHQQLMLKMLAKQAINLMEYRISAALLEENTRALEQKNIVIKSAEITLRSFFESAPNFHVLLGRSGEVLDFNKVAFNFIKKVHGAELDRGNMLVKFLAPDFVNKFLVGFNTALAGEKAFEEGSTDYGAHGVIYWEASFETAWDMNGEIIGISYIIRDVSDRKTREHKILAQNQSLLKIAHLQAHEFRAPLTTITGMLDLIRAEDYEAPREYFELLENAVKTLDSKIREVVDNVDDIVLEGNEVYQASSNPRS